MKTNTLICIGTEIKFHPMHTNPANTRHRGLYPVNTKYCMAFIQCRPNVFDAGPTLHKCYTNSLCLPGSAGPASNQHCFNVSCKLGINLTMTCPNLSWRRNSLTTLKLSLMIFSTSYPLFAFQCDGCFLNMKAIAKVTAKDDA